MSNLQQAICLLVATFHKYSDKEGDPNSLTKGEMKELLKNELGDILVKTSDKDAMDEFFNGLDFDKDETVDFQEYVILVLNLIMMMNEIFVYKK